MAIIVTNIVQEYGAYYPNSGQNRSLLLQLLLFGRETTKTAREIKTDDTVYRLAESSISSPVQPFQKTFTPKGDITFTPDKLTLFKMKVDMELCPDDIEDTRPGFPAGENQSRRDWPLIRCIMEEHPVKKIEEDLELKEYCRGVRTKPVAGAAGATGTSMNGLKHLLTNSDRVNRLTMDPLDTLIICDHLGKAYEQISEVYQRTPMLICMAPKWKRAFLKDKRAQGYYQTSKPGDIDNSLDFSPAKVTGPLHDRYGRPVHHAEGKPFAPYQKRPERGKLQGGRIEALRVRHDRLAGRIRIRTERAGAD